LCAPQDIRTRGLVLNWDAVPLDWIGLFYWIAAYVASQRGAFFSWVAAFLAKQKPLFNASTPVYESANYAKTWRSASRFIQYIALDRFSWSPLKYHAVRFTVVHSVKRSAYISSRENRSILKLRGFLAGGLSFPQVCCQNIGDFW
ncbi:hypothetical protein ALC56_13892, partial [Trachymyrmex septentrionalis]